MPETERSYQALSDMEQGQALWRHFYVWEAGRTNGAHSDIVKKLKGVGQSEVDTPEECDYLLVFCPVVSRVGTDVGEALNNKPPGKPVILVVMHHTFDRYYVVAESRRQVNDPNVYLTVDCLFHEGSLLNDCNLNEIMWADIKNLLGVTQVPNFLTRIIEWMKSHLVFALIIFVITALIIVITVVMTFKKADQIGHAHVGATDKLSG